ncbi:hypothetical protein C8R42DRAFT_597743 [Lentinula raphanica]|nr:hypothetical protein C8R42DRAFT_597743 [Lentinula raphanica]
MRTKGPGSFIDDKCSCSREAPALFRCRECFSKKLMCRVCCVKRHLDNPLHFIEEWSGQFFRRTSLFHLGLWVQLGHDDQSRCAIPKFTKLTVIHTSGIQHVRVAFCCCFQNVGVGHWKQLIRNEWYPATLERPKTCATFSVLNTFHKMTLEGKCTTYDFHSALVKLTNNTGQIETKDRYKDFLRMMRQWRHLKMLIHAGRGNDGVRNIEQTARGELAVGCPACPHPDINLPSNWSDSSNPLSFIYTLFIAIDACFRLKRKLVSSTEKDPYLQPGKAYLVEPEPFRRYLLTVTDQDEMCTCTGLAALDYANTRHSRGYAITGVGMCCCARHEIIGKNAAVPLQKGERYANIDYGLGSFLQHVDPRLRLLISYDIVCQWSKKCIERLKSLPPEVRIHLVNAYVKFVIPKLHIYGHKQDCQVNFSLNFTKGVGRTDAEGIERTWANMGPVSTSTKEMGPGSHAETLEDHWSHWNWEKIVHKGPLFRKRLISASKELVSQEESFALFTVEQAEHVPAWQKEVDRYQEDPTLPNPFEIPNSGKYAAEALLHTQRVLEGTQEDEGPTSQSVTDAEYLMQMLEAEEHQRQLSVEVALFRDPTSQQIAQITESRNRLQRKITRLRKLQAVVCPLALQVLSTHPTTIDSSPPHPESVPLLFPSDLPKLSSCSRLRLIEGRLRDGQCQDSLDQLRNDLLIKSRLHTYKKSNARHQGATTRTRSRMDRYDRKIKLSTLRYQRAWAAKLELVENDVTKVGWQKLRQEDIRTMHDVKNRNIPRPATTSEDVVGETEVDIPETTPPTGAPGEGFRTMSWIWMGSGSQNLATTLCTGLKVEWCKAYARVQRWREEVLILEEEMRRTLVYFEWKAAWWEAKAEVQDFEADHAAGVSAYAFQQANVWRSLKSSFERLWARNTDGSFAYQPNRRGLLPVGELFVPEYFDDNDDNDDNYPVSMPVEQEESEDDEDNEEDEQIIEVVELGEVEEGLLGDSSIGVEDVGAEGGTQEEDQELDYDDLDLEELALSGKYGPNIDY